MHWLVPIVVVLVVSFAMTVLIRPELFFKSLIGGHTRPVRKYRIDNEHPAEPTDIPAARTQESKDENHG